jgi:hypothetical protein
MCYLLHEGVVLGADSTSSTSQEGFHYFNNNQKLFEVGNESTLGIVTWGLGSLADYSHRTLIAKFADSCAATPPASCLEAATRWTDLFDAAYRSDQMMLFFNALHAKDSYDPALPADPARRDEKEEELYKVLANALVTGFCIGGRAGADRTPAAYEVLFEPLKTKPISQAIPMGNYRFWGVPNMAERLIFSADAPTRDDIVNSPMWTGTRADLDALLAPRQLRHPVVPIRDAVDFVHTCIYCTIKALKFSPYSQVCGGPIEIATVTTDRPFRWVRHKKWDAALLEGSLEHV